MALTDTEIKKAKPLEVSVPGHALRCRPETSVTSPLRGLWFELSGHEKTYIQPSRPWEGWGAATQCNVRIRTHHLSMSALAICAHDMIGHMVFRFRLATSQKQACSVIRRTNSGRSRHQHPARSAKSN
jgi:hypothetical protein